VLQRIFEPIQAQAKEAFITTIIRGLFQQQATAQAAFPKQRLARDEPR
jgi:hypothetical protein